jgi:hyperosmotically inducible protein
MKRLLSVGIAVALAFVALGCADTDPGITTSVKSRLAADDTVKAYQIDVDTREGVVTLSGNVPSTEAKVRAVALARETEGVRNVIDNLMVAGGSAALPGEHNTSPTAQAAEAEARDDARDAGDATRAGARDAGESARDAGQTARDAARDAGQATGDAAVTAAVKAKLLADRAVGGLKIDVDTKDGVVTLTGTVNNATEKSEAVRLARTTNGVKSVRDNLKVSR